MPVTKEQKEQFARFEQPPDYQTRVDEVKNSTCALCWVPKEEHQNGGGTGTPGAHAFISLSSMSNVELAHILAEAKTNKELHEALVKKDNEKIEAINQLMNVLFEDAGYTSFKLPDGRTFFQKQDVYVSVEQKEEFYAWLDANVEDPDSLYSINYMTAASLVKTRIEEGKELPPGVKVFIKESVQIRKGK
jgi:hypothetical protein